MIIAITGSKGFIGRNLLVNLKLNKELQVFGIDRKTDSKTLEEICCKCDFLIHSAGANRPKNKEKFKLDNVKYTNKIIDLLKYNKKKPSIIFTSSIKYNETNNYGISKKKAEKLIIKFSKKNKSKYFILRLANVYGKWAKPFYNSFISTIFYKITRNQIVGKIDKKKKINLIYIDDLVEVFKNIIFSRKKSFTKNIIGKNYNLIDIYSKIYKMWDGWKKNIIGTTSTSIDRKLFATMISYIPKKYFVKRIKKNTDPRGSFVEFLKTKKSGQFSFFTINTGKHRGGHFHNTKNEKFILLEGKIKLVLKNMFDDKKIEKKINSNNLYSITTVPGWKHTFINIGSRKAIMLVWANEMLNLKKMDTYRSL